MSFPVVYDSYKQRIERKNMQKSDKIEKTQIETEYGLHRVQ